MEIEMKAVQGTIVGLVIGAVLGGVVVSEWLPKQDVLGFNKSVNSETSKSVVTRIDYNFEKCSLSLKNFRFLGISDDSIRLDGGYQCGYLESKQEIENLKKALDKAVELGWVK